jgi:copper resistance protein C
VTLAGAAAPGMPARAAAHGLVLESSPKNGERVTAPARLVIRFNSRLEKPLCSVSLVGPERTPRRLTADTAPAAPDVLAYPLPALAPGAYQAKWKVLAADGHVTEGVLRFTVDGAR